MGLTEPSRKRIFVDLTTSYNWRGRNAVGIVRTEREIGLRLLDNPDIDAVPTIFSNGSLYAISPDDARMLITTILPESKDAPLEQPLIAQRGKQYLLTKFRKYAPIIARRILKLVPQPGREYAKQSLWHAYLAVAHVIKSRHRALLVPPPRATQPDLSVELIYQAHPSSVDTILLLGLGWDVVDCKKLGTIKRATGATIATVIYDLIPTKFPEFLGGEPKDYFRNYLTQMVDLSDHCYCISKTTESDFHDFCQSIGRKAPATSVIYLGANLPSKPSAEEFGEEARTTLTSCKFALAVGTFEVRKNYGFLLTLWEDLAKEDPKFDLNLVFAGMAGWGVDDLVSRLLRSPLYGKQIFWFKGLSDAGISWLYEKSHVVVFPSLYEGWGLPIIEAYQHRKPVISSNRGSVPEAGLGVSTVLDIACPGAWKEELMRVAKLPKGQVIPPVELPTWERAADEVIARVTAL